MSIVQDESVKELTKAVDRLIEALNQIDFSGSGATSQAKRVAGETSPATKEVAAATAVAKPTAAGGDVSSMVASVNPYIAAGKAAWSIANQIYDMSPLKQTGMPGLYDIHMQEYTKPRKQILQISEEYAQSGRALTQNEIQSIMKGINQQVTALQASEKLLRQEASVTPGLEKLQQKIFGAGASAVESGAKNIDQIFNSIVSLTELPDKINTIFQSLIDRVLK